MAYGKIKADTLTWDNAGTDTDITISTIPTASALAGKVNTSDIGTTVQAYDADNAVTDAAQTFTAAQRGSITTLNDGATITPDFAASNNFEVTLADVGRTLDNPINITAGQSGVIVINQDATGSRTITTYGSYFKFPGGSAPTLSTGANAVDILSYYCVSSTVIVASLGADFS